MPRIKTAAGWITVATEPSLSPSDTLKKPLEAGQTLGAVAAPAAPPASPLAPRPPPSMEFTFQQQAVPPGLPQLPPAALPTLPQPQPSRRELKEIPPTPLETAADRMMETKERMRQQLMPHGRPRQVLARLRQRFRGR